MRARPVCHQPDSSRHAFVLQYGRAVSGYPKERRHETNIQRDQCNNFLAPRQWTGVRVQLVGTSPRASLGPDDRDCVFFTLAGTPEPTVDPSVVKSPWIAIPRSQNGFKEIYAMLLWAKSTGRPTTGAAASASCTTHGTVVGLYQILTSS